MIADMLDNGKPNPMVAELFIGASKININLVFFTQSYATIPKNVRLTSAHYFFFFLIYLFILQTQYKFTNRSIQI